MKKVYGVVGHKGKLGSLLIQREGFVALDCDVTNIKSIETVFNKNIWENPDFDVVVNCAAISSIDECEHDYEKAKLVNIRGLSNLHDVFGSRVLNISSDHVFSEKSWYSPNEEKTPSPISAYGFTKYAAEGLSKLSNGKTIRLSRAVSILDEDIYEYLGNVHNGKTIEVPTFFHRNYIHREFIVDGIEFMAKNWDNIPQSLVNYGSTDNFNTYLFIHSLVKSLGLNEKLVTPRDEYLFLAPRPKRGGLRTTLSRKLGFPTHTIADTIIRLVEDYYA